MYLECISHRMYKKKQHDAKNFFFILKTAVAEQLTTYSEKQILPGKIECRNAMNTSVVLLGQT